MKISAGRFLEEKMLSGNWLSAEGVKRLLVEYAELCMDVQAKIIVSQPDVSGNEAIIEQLKKDLFNERANYEKLKNTNGEVAVAFAEWIGKNKWKYRKGLRWEQLTKKLGKLYYWQTIEQLYETFEQEKAKATDR